MKPDISFVLKSGHFYLLTTLTIGRLFAQNGVVARFVSESYDPFAAAPFAGDIQQVIIHCRSGIRVEAFFRA
jgi:hypothetical protein